MKILVIVLLVLGGGIVYSSSRIAPVIFRKEQPSDGELVAVKSVGFAMAVIAAIIAFVL